MCLLPVGRWRPWPSCLALGTLELRSWSLPCRDEKKGPGATRATGDSEGSDRAANAPPGREDRLRGRLIGRLFKKKAPLYAAGP